MKLSPSTPAPDPLTVSMLQTAAITQACVGSWPLILKERLFTPGRPDKAEVRRRRDLASAAALVFLQVLWKETGAVTEAELAEIGAERIFNPEEGVTCHGMAVEAAIEKREVDKLDKRVRAIMRAARHYGLVEEARIGPKKKTLRATERLRELLQEHHEALERVARTLTADVAR